MRLLLLFTFLFTIIISCNPSAEKLPVEKEKLRDILIDIHIAEAAMQEFPLQNKDSVGRSYYRQIFLMHEVKEESFNKSMYLIKQDPEELDALYKDVLEELERREKETK